MVVCLTDFHINIWFVRQEQNQGLVGILLTPKTSTSYNLVRNDKDHFSNCF